MRNFFIFFIASCILLIQQQSHADSVSGLVEKGNAAYFAGKYDEALAAYDEASVDAPESPQIYFNRGAALYGKGDYGAAAEAFEKAALKSKDIGLEALSKYNLGNCAFREAERQQDSDLNKALEACGRSIQHYQEALALDPDLTEAAENIEVVRLIMKTLIDEINKQKEAQKQQQEAMQQTKEQLKKLIEKQQKALTQNQKLADDRSAKGDSQHLRDQTNKLAEDQKNLKKETEDLAKNLPKPGGQSTPQVENPAERHLKNAAKEQVAASGNLEQQNNTAAKRNQEKALEALNHALDSLNDGQESKGQKQCQPKDSEQQQPSSPDKPQQGKEGQEDKQQAMSRMSEDAHDILDEEKENREQRQMKATGDYRAVDRDW